MGFCFKERKKREVYTYQPFDLLELNGDRRGRIVKTSVLDSEYWIEMTHIFNTSPLNLAKYNQYIASWASNAGSYSIFDNLGVTTRMFVEKTVSFFISTRDEITTLVSPKITFYNLQYLNKMRVDRRYVEEWYRLLVCSGSDERSMVELALVSGEYYHCEVVDGQNMFYHLTGVTVREASITLDLDREDQAIPIASVTSCAVGVDCSSSVVTTTNTVAATTSSSEGGLIVIVLLFTILIVLLVIAVLILEHYSEAELIGTNPIADAIPTIIPV